MSLAVAIPFSVCATTISLGAAGEFNTFIFNDFSNSSDTEGRLAVGGNATLSGYSVGDKLNPGQYKDSLIVGKDLKMDGGRVYYGDIIVGGDATMPNYKVADGTLFTGQENLPINFSKEEAYLKSLSATLSKEANNGRIKAEYGGLYLTGDGTDGTQVFNLDGMDLLNAHTFTLSNVNENAIVLFNVSNDLAGLTNMNLGSLASIRNNVLFNFYEATSLTLQGIAVEGSILAPFANVINPQGVINGTIIANSWDGPMQQNHTPFNSSSSPVPTPEPGTSILLFSGLIFVARFIKNSK